MNTHDLPLVYSTLDVSPFELGCIMLDVAPVLYEGPMKEWAIDDAAAQLRQYGSAAAPGFDQPEGVVIWHDASRTSWKVLPEGDDRPKGRAGHALDEEADRG